MEETYGKHWETRLEQSTPSITNAYIQGYKDKESEDKIARRLTVSSDRKQWFIDKFPSEEENEVDNLLPNMGKLFGIEIVSDKFMPDHLGALLDGEGNVISFLEFKEKINK